MVSHSYCPFPGNALCWPVLLLQPGFTPRIKKVRVSSSFPLTGLFLHQTCTTRSFPFPIFFFFYCVPKKTHLTSSPPQVKITEGTCCWITRQNSQKNPFPTHQLAPTGCCAVSNSSALPLTYGYCQLKFQPKPIEW